MNAEAALVDQTVDPVDPRGARIVGLQGAADCVAALDDRERYGVKERANPEKAGKKSYDYFSIKSTKRLYSSLYSERECLGVSDTAPKVDN